MVCRWTDIPLPWAAADVTEERAPLSHLPDFQHRLEGLNGVTAARQAESCVAKLNDLIKKCGGQRLSRLLSFCSIGAVTVVLTGEIVAALKHQYHTKLTN